MSRYDTIVLFSMPYITEHHYTLEQYIQERAIPLEELTSLNSHTLSFLANYQMILLGEIHGINETPQLALGLIRLLHSLGKKVVLAIEVWDSEQKNIDHFLQTGNFDELKNTPFFASQPQYGIGSQALAHLLQQARGLSEVFCFDINSKKISFNNQEDMLAFSQLREKLMAHKLLKKYYENKDAIFIVLTGSVHALPYQTSILGKNYTPMGYWISQNINSLSISLKYQSGSSWNGYFHKNNMVYGVHSLPPICDVYSQAVNYKHYFLSLDQHQDSIFFSREITPSYPLSP